MLNNCRQFSVYAKLKRGSTDPALNFIIDIQAMILLDNHLMPYNPHLCGFIIGAQDLG